MPKIKSVVLLSSLFADQRSSGKEISYCLAIESFERSRETVSEDGAILFSAKASFNLFKDVQEPQMTLVCSYLITYLCKDKDEVGLLHDHVIVAHIIPYLREHVSNLTMKSRFPAFYLETVNTYDLLKKFRGDSGTAKQGK